MSPTASAPTASETFDMDAYRARRAARPDHAKTAEFLGDLAKALFPYGREDTAEIAALRMDLLAFAAHRCARMAEGA
jgi:hypothetical protein